jgi:glycosyltransferase involved in cell wall biosynthesis
MRYSIITVTHNGLAFTVKCINSILQYTQDYELIVVDNGSTDGTVGYLNALMEKHDNVKCIFNKENGTYAKANNQGYAISSGDHVCFLNNDTVVNNNWIDRLSAHLYGVPLKNIGIVGPITNSSNGKQAYGHVSDPEKWYLENRGRWSHTGRLYGWCLLMRRALLEEIGTFDERFDNSHEDNDLCIRAQLAGYQLVIAYDTWIHHTGQGTFRNMVTAKEYLDRGYINRETYYDKYWDERPRKLVAVYRLGNCEKYIWDSLVQTSKFADYIIVHLCRSTDNTEEIVRQFPKVIKVGKYDGIFQEDYERNWLLQEALKTDADWCISIDGDEVYEDKFIERSQKMMRPRNPEIFAYMYRWRTIWEKNNGTEYFRSDSTFGGFTNYRFFRLIKGQEITSRHPEGHHCGSAPIIAPENIVWSSIRVKHLGYDTPEQRQQKYEFYEANDHFKSARDIGNKDYSHLIDRNVQLEKYDPDIGISCIMMVRDEEEDILPCIEHMECVVDEFVIVDTGSKDKTIELIEKFAKYATVPVKLLHMPWCDNYSIPRNFAKLHATKSWILMMDADERFDCGDVDLIYKMIETDADAVIFHVLNYMKKTLPGETPVYASTESVRLYRNIPELYYTGIIHETIDDSMAMFNGRRTLNVAKAPFPLHHKGYLKGRAKVEGKMQYYERLNKEQIEITEGKDPRPYYNLALHYLSGDKEKEALVMFQKSLTVNPNFWHSSQQMAALNIKCAKIFLQNTIDSIPPKHPFKNEAQEILNYLNKKSFGVIKPEEDKCQLQAQRA